MNDEAIACGRARRELPALVYDELEGALRAGVEAHLAVCDSCRRVHEDMSAARAALDRWPAPVASASGAGPRPSRPVPATTRAPGRRLALAALAASLLALATLAVGTEIRREAGRVVLAFGRSPSDGGAERHAGLAAAVERELAQRWASHAAENERWRANLVQAIDGARAEDRRALTLMLEEALHQGSLETLRTRQALAGIADRLALDLPR